MKSTSIAIIAILGLVALCSSTPVAKQVTVTEIQARIDFYNDFLSGLFTNLVQTTFGSVSALLNQLITENPLGLGKRDIEESRVSALSFLYDNILQDFFSGLVTNTFSTLSNTLTGLITSNPLGLGKRDTDESRVSALSFLYDNILQDFFSGLVTNTFSTLSNTLTGLITSNPLGLGKRDIEESRVSALSFLYDNILQDFFSGLVTNTFSTLSNTLTGLITSNPLGLGKRDVEQSRASALSFLYDNILQDFFSGLVTNTFSTLSSTLTGLITSNPLGWGKRSINAEQLIQMAVSPVVLSLIQKLTSYVHQAVAVWNKPAQLAQLVSNAIAEIKAAVAALAQQFSQIIPSAIHNQVTQFLAAVQSILIFWTSGLAGSLGPILGSFQS